MADVQGQQVEIGMPTATHRVDIGQEGIDLWVVFSTLWKGKWIIASLTFLAGVTAVVFTLLMPNVYRSETLLAPAEESNSAGLMAIASQLGGIASLAGVDIGKVEATKMTIALEVLKSRAFISEFVTRRNLLVPLVAAKNIDPASGKLVLDESLYDEVGQRWIGFGDAPDSRPSEWKAYKEFSRIMKVSQAKDTGLVMLSIDHVSPQIAQQWVAWLVEDLNEQMRRRDIDEANKSINYLRKQLAQTPLAEMKQIFYQLIEKQIQTIMLANVRDQYVFKIIDPPVVPEEKVSPRRASIVVMSVMSAFVIASVFVLVMAAYRNTHQPTSSKQGQA